MGRIKLISFYCIMAVMTLLIIEGMAQGAYYIAYGEFNGGGPAAAGTVAPADAAEDDIRTNWVIQHPYYGYTRTDPGYRLNQPPPRREDGVVLIALVGGSVGRYVAPAFQSALEAWFQDNDIPLRPVALELATNGMKQPQQVMVIANTLSLGGEYDIIVNLDGHNELLLSHNNYFESGISPFYPLWWPQLVTFTAEDKLKVGHIAVERARRERRLATARAAPWRWSALYGIISRYRLERSERRLLALNRELAAPTGDYSLERRGPQYKFQDHYDLRRAALRVWYRGSVILNDLSRTAGAEYYHFLQPNQYVPDSKPLSDEELAMAYNAGSAAVAAYRDAYPQLQRLGDELRQQGINYYDLTQIFADNRETLYKNNCCHLNARGNELLAESMVQILEPALRRQAALAAARVGGGGSATAGAALYPAARETWPTRAVNKLYFDVRLTAAGALRYSRDGCRPADTAAPFFVRIAPVDAADLLPGGAASGYNSYDFSFSRDGGVTDAAGRCVIEYELPEYDIETVLTGQYIGETGRLLWRARITLDAGFEVKRTTAGALRYSQDNCLPVHLAQAFFLHITPVDAADLHPAAVEYGFNNYDFPGFSQNGGVIDAAGRCIVERELPEYDIASIHTGQYTNAAGRLWETRVDFE